MAEPAQIMMFPARISELEAERELRRRRFDDSVENLRSSVRDHFNPITLVQKYPKILISGLVSLTGTLLGLKSLPVRKVEKPSRLRGWASKAAMMGGMALVKMAFPLLADAVKFGLRKVKKKAR